MGETTVLKNAFSKWSPVDLVCYSSPALIAYLQQSVQKIEPVAKREFVSFAEDKLGLPDLVVSLIWRFAAPRKRQGDVLGKVLANALYQELNALDKLDEKIEDTVIEVENKLSNTRQGTEIVLKDCDQTFKPWRDRNLRAYSRRLGRYTRLGGGFCRRCPNARRHLGKKKNDDVKAQEEREKQKLEEEKQKLAEKEAEERLKEKLEEEKQKQAEKANLEEGKILDESDLIKQPLARARGELDVVQAELEQKATAAQADMDGPQKLKDLVSQKRLEQSIASLLRT
jgi:hypothetical protein